MDLIELLPIILSSAVVSAIITFFSSKKDREVSNISQERVAWGNKIREIAEQIRDSENSRELLKLMDMLEIRINPLGRINSTEQPQALSREIKNKTIFSRFQTSNKAFLQIGNRLIKIKIKKTLRNEITLDLKTENDHIIEILKNMDKGQEGILQLNGRDVKFKVIKVKDYSKKFGETRYTQRDSFLWDNIKHIRKKIENNETITDSDKDDLIYSISIALKQNWEKSKSEVKGSLANFISIVTTTIIILSLIMLGSNDEIKNNPLLYFLIIPIVVLIFNRLLDWNYDLEISNSYWYAALNTLGAFILGWFFYISGTTFNIGFCLIIIYFVSLFSNIRYVAEKNSTISQLYSCILQSDFMKKNSERS